MRLPLALVRGFLGSAVRGIYGPPVPVRVQRVLGDAMGRSQPVPPAVAVTEVVLGGRPARRYAAPGARADAAVLWVHGGAFITGSHATHGSFAAHLALAAGVPVYLLDYRLAPEHPHPAAVQDVVAAHAWIPEGRVLLGGDSAGGCLALLAAPSLEVAGVALVSPLLDLTMASGKAWTGGDVLIRTAWGEQGIAAMFPAGLPVVPDPVVPTVVHVAEHERLRPEGEALAARVGAELLVVRRGWHDIHLQAGLVREAGVAVDQLGASVARLLADR